MGNSSRAGAAAALMLIAAFAAACANPRESATKLGNAGLEAATTMHTKVLQTADRIDGTITLDCLSLIAGGGFTAADCASFEEGAGPSVHKLAKAVRARKKAIADLKTSYKELVEIAATDKKKEWEESTGKLIDSVNVYLGVLGIGAITAPAKIIISKLGGIVADQQQREDILTQNAALKTAVTALADGMKRERIWFHDVNGMIVSSERAARNILLKNRVMSRAALFKPTADSLGVALREDADAVIDRSAKLRELADWRAERNAQESLAAEDTAYEASISALDQLTLKHEELAAEAEDISVGSVIAQVNELAGIIKEIQDAKAAK